MNLRRDEILDEMGLGPVWKLRVPAAASAVGETVDAPEAAIGPCSDGVAGIENQPADAADQILGRAMVFGGESGAAAASADAKQRPAAKPSPPPQPLFPADADAREAQIARLGWDELERSIADCRACGLCAGRQQAVPGVGDRQADWLFIGEGPGAEEDARGEPFVGQAGKLLDAMLAAIDLQRGEDVYIANAVKCRPPNNRTPEAAEMAACAPYLRRQIALLAPRVIVLLGRAATHAVLGSDGALSGLRGQSLSYPGASGPIPVVVTYHPAYLLRTLPDKARSWEDLCRARALMRQAKAGQFGAAS